ncbi:MAG: hypothetical protein AAF206_13635, partial [Bacteroidota bacterium]
MKKLLYILLFLTLILKGGLAFATDYVFSAKADHLYENPANWKPAYPGIRIEAHDKVIIRDEVYLTHFSL